MIGDDTKLDLTNRIRVYFLLVILNLVEFAAKQAGAQFKLWLQYCCFPAPPHLCGSVCLFMYFAFSSPYRESGVHIFVCVISNFEGCVYILLNWNASRYFPFTPKTFIFLNPPLQALPAIHVWHAYSLIHAQLAASVSLLSLTSSVHCSGPFFLCSIC